MPFNAGTVEGKLELDAKGFVDALNRARKSLDSMAKQNKKTGSSLQTFSRALGTLRDAVIVLPAAFRAVTAPIRGLFNQLREASGVAAEFEVTTRKLTTALALSGESAAGKVTERLKEFADAQQEVTGLSNTLALSVAQTLTVLGVQSDDLEEFTAIVLDYAEATGRDANQAGLQFGRTLSGLTGELGEALPAVRELTPEILMTGEAFRVAGEIFRGTAEQVAKTTTGIRRAFQSAFGDLQRAVGDAINPVLDAITLGLKSAVESLTELVRANESNITAAFAGVARGALDAIRGVLDFALDIPEMVARVRVFISEVVAAFKVGGADVEITALRIIERVQVALSDLFASLQDTPLFGDDFKIASDNLLASASETQEAILRGTRAMEEQTASLRQGVKEQQKVAEAAAAAADAIRDGTDQTSAMAVGWRKVNEAVDATQQSLNNVKDTTVDIDVAVSSTTNRMQARLKVLREITGVSGEIRDRAEILADETARATSNTEGLAAAARSAASGFKDAANAATDMASATASAGASRRSGGSAGLNLDDPFSAIQALLSAQQGLRAANFGSFSAARTRGQRQVVNQIAGATQAAVDRALADFTDGLVQELNRMGVFDPQERQTFINDRISEAQRFGVLPPTTFGTFGGISTGF